MEASQSLDWQQLDDMPVGHWEPASIVLDGKLVVLGGYPVQSVNVLGRFLCICVVFLCFRISFLIP